MKNFKYEINTKPEKAIVACAVSVAVAILFDQKKKKPSKRKNFVQRVSKNYKVIDSLLAATVAKKVADNEKQKAKQNEYKSKLKDLEIQDAEFIDL